jgi:hypothetical protein
MVQPLIKGDVGDGGGVTCQLADATRRVAL